MIETSLLSCISSFFLAGQFVRIELFNKIVNGYGQEFFIAAYVLYSFYTYRFIPFVSLVKRKSVLFIFFTFVFSFLFSFSQFSVVENSISFLFPLRIALYLCFGVYLYYSVKQKKDTSVFIRSLLYTTSIILLITTAIQYVFFTNLWGLYSAGWDPHAHRTYVTFLDVYVAAAIFGSFFFYWIQKRKWIFVALFLLALILSFSRSAYLALIFSVFVALFPKKKWREFIVILNFFVILVLLVPKPFGEGVHLFRTASISSRIRDYTNAVSLWKNKPILGYGYNRIRFAKEKTGVIRIDDTSHAASSFHSSYAIILVSMGLLGLIFFVFLLFDMMKSFPGIRSILIFLSIMSFFDNVLLHVLVILPFIFILVDQNKKD